MALFTVPAGGKDPVPGAYLPVDAQLFNSDLAKVEGVFADLFTTIQRCTDPKEGPSRSWRTWASSWATSWSAR